jgi:multidrug resistance efflux pump
MMTPEQKFARWVRVSIASFLLMFVYFIVADIWIPLTPDATVMRVVTPVSSRVPAMSRTFMCRTTAW